MASTEQAFDGRQPRQVAQLESALSEAARAQLSAGEFDPDKRAPLEFGVFYQPGFPNLVREHGALKYLPREGVVASFLSHETAGGPGRDLISSPFTV